MKLGHQANVPGLAAYLGFSISLLLLFFFKDSLALRHSAKTVSKVTEWLKGHKMNVKYVEYIEFREIPENSESSLAMEGKG